MSSVAWNAVIGMPESRPYRTTAPSLKRTSVLQPWLTVVLMQFTYGLENITVNGLTRLGVKGTTGFDGAADIVTVNAQSAPFRPVH